MFTDANAFWRYDNRESLMQQSEQEEEGDRESYSDDRPTTGSALEDDDFY